jgi:hypothetical protein
MICPPEVTTSSTMTSLRPSTSPPSGQLAGAVGLRLLAYEQHRQAGQLGHDGRDRDAAELQPGQRLAISWEQLAELLGDLAQQPRVALEPVLIEVPGAARA